MCFFLRLEKKTPWNSKLPLGFHVLPPYVLAERIYQIKKMGEKHRPSLGKRSLVVSPIKNFGRKNCDVMI